MDPNVLDNAPISTQATAVEMQSSETVPASSPVFEQNQRSSRTESDTMQENEGSIELSFTEQISQYQAKLENNFQEFENSLADRSTDVELKDVDWNELEKRYQDEMSGQITAEQDIMNDFSARFKQFMLWMQVSDEKEADRGLKRLRTRAAFVQNSEEQLIAKQEHYAKVLEAFQTAMRLLSNL